MQNERGIQPALIAGCGLAILSGNLIIGGIFLCVLILLSWRK